MGARAFLGAEQGSVTSWMLNLCEVSRATPNTTTAVRADCHPRRERPERHSDFRLRLWMVNGMLAPDKGYASVLGETDLRRQLDRSVSRALVDPDYATLLLADPTLILEDRGCPPQQYLSLRSIQASTLVDFARQAQALFWAFEPCDEQPAETNPLPVSAAAR